MNTQMHMNTSLPEKETNFTLTLIQSVLRRYGKHFQKEWVDLEIKNLDEYPDLFFQCNKSLVVDIFETVRDKFIEIYEGDPVHFVLATGLA